MIQLRQLRAQTAYDLLIFRRNPAGSFFTLILPLIFFFLFLSIFGNTTDDDGVRAATYLVPGILGLQITSATLVNLAMTMTSRRERGILKRIRGTPLEPWVFVAAQALAALVISLVSAVLLIGLGWLVYDVSVRAAGLVPLALSVVIGSMALSALGLALTAVIPSEQSAPAVTNAVVLPLYFISDVFIVGDKPATLELIASVFPIQHLVQAMVASFDPLASGVPWPVVDWLILTGWGLAGLVATLVGFRWTPNR